MVRIKYILVIEVIELYKDVQVGGEVVERIYFLAESGELVVSFLTGNQVIVLDILPLRVSP